MTVPLDIFSVFFMAMLLQLAHAKCGGYIEIKNFTESGSLSSPNYPASYPPWYRCIWYMQAPKNYNIKLEIGQVNGEYDVATATCLDGLTVTNGSSELPVLFEKCRGEIGVVVSPSRWLWVYFKSDKNEVVNTGFTANWTVVAASKQNDLDKEPKFVSDQCVNVRNRCPNKECFPKAYRCDGQMDCGCEEPGCDEAECGTFEMSETVKISLGVGVGVAVFLFVFLGVGFLEILLKIWHERDFKKKTHDQRMKERKIQSQKEVAQMTKLVEKHESTLKLDVPSIRASTCSSISIKTAASSNV